MVNFCAVFGCSNRSSRERSKSFYRLPSIVEHQGPETHMLSEKRRTLWLSRLRRADLKESQYSNVRICSDHFVKGKPSSLYEQDDPDWAPSLRLGHSSVKDGTSAEDRHSRSLERNRKKKVLEKQEAECMKWEEGEQPGIASQSAALTAVETCVQTDLNASDIERLCHQGQDMQSIRERLQYLVFDMDSAVSDESRLSFYTGLPGTVLDALAQLVCPHLMQKSTLVPFQQLILTLMKLRLGLSQADLGYRFQISQSTVSRIFCHCVNVMYVRLRFLIKWPERSAIRKTMPMAFRKHCPKCTVIIDCFEVFIERPSNLLARAQTYSSYKHHNTTKYLIGVTPQGTVCFISSGWGGRASDKHVTESSRLLSFLLPGDTILADRGFDIADSVGLCMATIKMPAFTKGKAQLRGIEVEQTRRIANVRIHVERVIGNLRQKYSLLQETQPIHFLIAPTDGEPPLLDKITTVCCALVNMSNSVVPFD